MNKVYCPECTTDYDYYPKPDVPFPKTPICKICGRACHKLIEHGDILLIKLFSVFNVTFSDIPMNKLDAFFNIKRALEEEKRRETREIRNGYGLVAIAQDVERDLKAGKPPTQILEDGIQTLLLLYQYRAVYNYPGYTGSNSSTSISFSYQSYLTARALDNWSGNIATSTAYIGRLNRAMNQVREEFTLQVNVGDEA